MLARSKPWALTPLVIKADNVDYRIGQHVRRHGISIRTVNVTANNGIIDSHAF